MKKILSSLLLSVLCITALTACQSTQKSPKWVNLPLSENTAKDWIIQYDQNSVIKNPENTNWLNIIVLSQPMDPKAYPNAKYASMISNATIDCENKAIRFIRMQTYTGRDGMGEIVDNKEINSDFNPANSSEDIAIIKTICQ